MSSNKPPSKSRSRSIAFLLEKVLTLEESLEEQRDDFKAFKDRVESLFPQLLQQLNLTITTANDEDGKTEDVNNKIDGTRQTQAPEIDQLEGLRNDKDGNNEDVDDNNDVTQKAQAPEIDRFEGLRNGKEDETNNGAGVGEKNDRDDQHYDNINFDFDQQEEDCESSTLPTIVQNEDDMEIDDVDKVEDENVGIHDHNELQTYTKITGYDKQEDDSLSFTATQIEKDDTKGPLNYEIDSNDNREIYSSRSWSMQNQIAKRRYNFSDSYSYNYFGLSDDVSKLSNSDSPASFSILSPSKEDEVLPGLSFDAMDSVIDEGNDIEKRLSPRILDKKEKALKKQQQRRYLQKKLKEFQLENLAEEIASTSLPKHKRVKKQTNDTPFVCSKCTFIFKTSKYLKRHIKNKICTNNDKSFISKTKKSKSLKKSNSKKDKTSSHTLSSSPFPSPLLEEQVEQPSTSSAEPQPQRLLKISGKETKVKNAEVCKTLFNCKVCDLEFKSAQSLIMHRDMDHFMVFE